MFVCLVISCCFPALECKSSDPIFGGIRRHGSAMPADGRFYGADQFNPRFITTQSLDFNPASLCFEGILFLTLLRRESRGKPYLEGSPILFSLTGKLSSCWG